MMAMLPRIVNCSVHGMQGVGLACQHVLAAYQADKTSVGFFWSDDHDQARPDAWCDACENALVQNEWSEAWHAAAGFSMLCALCWDDAKRIAESENSSPDQSLEDE